MLKFMPRSCQRETQKDEYSINFQDFPLVTDQTTSNQITSTIQQLLPLKSSQKPLQRLRLSAVTPHEHLKRILRIRLVR